MIEIESMNIDELRSLRNEVNRRIKEEKYSDTLICGVTKFDRKENSKLKPYRISVKRKNWKNERSRWVSIITDGKGSEILPYLDTVIKDLQELERKMRENELLQNKEF